MASKNFLLLIAIALVPFAIARRNPSDKDASQIDLPQQDGLYETLGHIIDGPPHHHCLNHPSGTTQLEGTGEYEPSGLLTHRCTPPPPPSVPETPPPTSPGPILQPILAPILEPTLAPIPVTIPPILAPSPPLIPITPTPAPAAAIL